MPVKLQISVSRESLIFQKNFPDAGSSQWSENVSPISCTGSNIAKQSKKKKTKKKKQTKNWPLKPSYVISLDKTAGENSMLLPASWPPKCWGYSRYLLGRRYSPVLLGVVRNYWCINDPVTSPKVGRFFFLKLYLSFSLILTRRTKDALFATKYFRNGVRFGHVTSVLVKKDR